MQTTKINWVVKDGVQGMTWNPVTGCTKVGSGCLNCYAERTALRLKAMGSPNYRNGFEVTLHPHKLDEPLKRKKPTIIFVNSMSDLFHEDVEEWFIRDVLEVMADCQRHVFVVLTKRSCRMRVTVRRLLSHAPNVYLGVSVSTQADIDRDLPHLAKLAKAGWKTIVSVEPLLEAVDLGKHLDYLSGVIVGCESGPGRRACDRCWIDDVVSQCSYAEGDVPCYVKQIIARDGMVIADPDLAEWPWDFERRLPWVEGRDG